MSKIRKHWEKGMDDTEKFVGYQAMNFGRTSIVSSQILTLVLGDIGCGMGKRKQI